MTLPTTLTTTFSVTAFGAASPASLGARLAAVPPDNTLPNLWGLRLISDVTATVGQKSTRTFVHAMSPGEGAASISCTLEAGEKGAKIKTFTIGGAGDGYAAPPILTTSPVGSERRMIVYPSMFLSSLSIVNAGSGYTPGTYPLVFSGGGLWDGSGATGRFHVGGGGTVDGVFIDTVNGFYNNPPDVVLAGAGSGINAYVQGALGIGDLAIVDPGQFWDTPPTIIITPTYYANCSGGDYLGPMRHWMTGPLQLALRTTVLADEPVAS